MKLDFKILSRYFIKILSENYSHGNFKIFMFIFSYYTMYPIEK